MPARLLSYNVLSALDRVPRKFGASSGSRHLLGNLIGAVADEEFDDVEVEADTILDAVNAFVMGALPMEVPRKRSAGSATTGDQRHIERHFRPCSASTHRWSKGFQTILAWLSR